jgi:hypothetical protein
MTLNLSELTVLELKNMCKKKKIKGYSSLVKNDLIKLLKKHIKKGGEMNIINNATKLDNNKLEKHTFDFWEIYYEVRSTPGLLIKFSGNDTMRKIINNDKTSKNKITKAEYLHLKETKK